jgi:pilus assembly protein CpaE
MRCERGQATVELVGVLPLLALLGLLCWQAVVAGQAIWLSGAAARAAARASALDQDATAAARRVLPGALDPGVSVDDAGGGDVKIRLRIPAVVGGIDLATIDERARFAAQSG